MGAAKSSSTQLSDIVGEQVMKNIYNMTNSCEQITDQKQNLNMNISGSIVGNVSQTQTTNTDLQCLANNKFTELFDSSFKNNLQTNLENSVTGVGAVAATKSKVTQKIANMLYTESQINSIQKTINDISQTQNATVNIENSVLGAYNQSQAVTAILQQVSDVTKEAMVQAKQEQEMSVTQKNVAVGTDITAIATTAIKTAGEVAKAFTGMFMIGAVIFVIIFVIVVVVVIIFIKRNCGAIKTALGRVGMVVPVVGLQMKVLQKVMGMFCPGDTQSSQKKK